MRTSKPISTISYNTKEYLIKKLDELYNNGKITDYMFIKHQAEEDETKEHIHLYIEPNRMLDTFELQKYFQEIDLQNPKKPLGCIPFHSTKSVDDWLLYALHYEPYLLTKGEERVFHYTREDIVYKDELSFEYMYNHAFKGSEWAKRNQILQAIREGTVDPASLILNGTVPLNLAGQLDCLSRMKRGKTVRGDYKGHEYI